MEYYQEKAYNSYNFDLLKPKKLLSSTPEHLCGLLLVEIPFGFSS